ncbi:malto-oligosyltrehalose trehalohydrolase [Chloroflexota bacterium]
MSIKDGLGAVYLGNDHVQFLVWAPLAQEVDVHIVAPQERFISLKRDERGYHRATVEAVLPGSLYFYRLDGKKERPDPASRSQSDGVHGPSQVVDCNFSWEDGCWFGLPFQDYIIYELHVGSFTSEGTFDAIIPLLDELKELGITALELMPVAQFPGNRNWGYDGVYLFAVQNSYGGPEGMKRLVNACHNKGLAVILDVVYNHMGPEGNYLGDYGYYFTDRYRTLWGQALNFDGPDSDEVRRFFIENAVYWLKEFHIDALRLDAVHAILDHSPRPFIEELSINVHEQAQRMNRQVYLIPESAANDARLIRSPELGGYGLDAQWNDDFHHALRILLTGERTGYYCDFGDLQQLVKAFKEGFVYSGEYSSYHRHRHGSSSRDIQAHRFVVFSQNHDQVGNRMLGERLSQTISFDGLKLAAGIVLLSPFIPLLFMGEEYGETAPFQYFISHSDQALVDAVRRGRYEEFAAFQWPGEPPDPQDEITFLQTKLNHHLRQEGNHRVLLEFYKVLIRLRKEVACLTHLSKEAMDVTGYNKEEAIFLRRWTNEDEIAAIFCFNESCICLTVPLPSGNWQKLLDSAEEGWNGPGSQIPLISSSEGELNINLQPQAFVVFHHRKEI